MLLGGNKNKFQCSQTIKNIHLFLMLNYLDIFSFVLNYFKIIVTVHPAIITRISLEVHRSPYGDRINNSGSKPSTQNPLQYVRSVYLFRNHSSLVPLFFLLHFLYCLTDGRKLKNFLTATRNHAGGYHTVSIIDVQQKKLKYSSLRIKTTAAIAVTNPLQIIYSLSHSPPNCFITR